MDAAHFRERAARARAMAHSGDDLRLMRMLLDVANDLEAEADLIDAEVKARGTDTNCAPKVIEAAGTAGPGMNPGVRRLA